MYVRLLPAAAAVAATLAMYGLPASAEVPVVSPQLKLP